MSITKAFKAMDVFQGVSLTESLSKIEKDIVGHSVDDMKTFCGGQGIDNAFMASAVSIKKLAGQINTIIHAAGILCALPHLLEPGEKVKSVSLGAGNTGRKFDLETNKRIAEFKFIDWRGGAESIRQNGIFKDFFELAEYDTRKKKCLYVVGTDYPLKFLNGGRALTSVLSRQNALHGRLVEKYGAEVKTVRQYYRLTERKVQICDVSPFIGRGVAEALA
ncbi:MAG: hypothetical protein Q8K71_08795 [Polaromonas sp.]|nr:hypothetical protein [Polaromonas sp.]MDP3753468.1 hypothetical protein [Polaromonas sp.]